MNSFSPDIRFAVRSLRRASGFTLTAVLCLAGALGATTVMSGIVNTLFLQPPPGVRQAGQVLRLNIVRRTGAVLFTGFGLATLLLAALGLYGVVAYIVLQRTRDIGIRMALGADSARVVTSMMWQGLAPIGGGGAAGLLIAIVASRFLRSRLYGVTPADPATFAIVVTVLGAVAALACFVPARRAARVDPVIALRAE
jgi:putative ABC transport system permease protein